MADTAVSALGGAQYEGFATVTEAPPQGMITLRGDPADAALRETLRRETGLEVPPQRAILHGSDGRAIAWMAPDELMLLVPHGEATALTDRLQSALEGHFALAVEMSDARALFAVEGPQAHAVLAKLCPVDFAELSPGEIRRTRCAQVAAALWMEAPGHFRLICFRSVAQYVFDLLARSARPGGEVGRF